jgi:hypothetical protein
MSDMANSFRAVNETRDRRVQRRDAKVRGRRTANQLVSWGPYQAFP